MNILFSTEVKVEKGWSFQQMCQSNWVSYAETKKQNTFDPYLLPYIKINSKWMKALKVKLKTVKLLKHRMKPL